MTEPFTPAELQNLKGVAEREAQQQTAKGASPYDARLDARLQGEHKAQADLDAAQEAAAHRAAMADKARRDAAAAQLQADVLSHKTSWPKTDAEMAAYMENYYANLTK